MSQVTIRINGRPYDIACEDGQEDHLQRLADHLEKRVQEVVATVGQIGEARVLIMASLLIADELSDAYAQIDTARADPDAETAKRLQAEGAAKAEARAAQVFELLADRLDKLASGIEADGRPIAQSGPEA